MTPDSYAVQNLVPSFTNIEATYTLHFESIQSSTVVSLFRNLDTKQSIQMGFQHSCYSQKQWLAEEVATSLSHFFTINHWILEQLNLHM